MIDYAMLGDRLGSVVFHLDFGVAFGGNTTVM